MESGLYAAYTGLMARMQALDTASNNVANAGTTGFRAQRDYFRGVLESGLGAGEQGSQVGNSVNGFGVLGGSVPDFAQGPIVATSNPLDLALNGAGFFAIQTAQGTRYTRDGSFMKSPAGQLTTRTGEAVLDAAGKPITLPSGEVDISADGTISVAGAVVDGVGVFQLAGDAGLEMEGANRFRAAAGAKAVAATDCSVKQGSLEGANQDAVHSTMQLVLIQRQAEMMQKAMSVFANDFDKTATEQLGKV
jgi:flagellar basal-body rod protein FlgF/flagellar basal-body rod protein FlgG